MNILDPYYIFIRLIETNILIAWVVLIAAFVILAKCADMFVDSSVKIADKLRVPKLVIGIILVSLATTAPELAVSMMAAVSGMPQMALGNAIGSVICDDGLALALAGIIAASPIVIMPNVLKTSGIFLLFIEIITFIFVLFDNTLNRLEGVVLVLLFVCYIVFLFYQNKKRGIDENIELDISTEKDSSNFYIAAFFIISLAGIIVSSRFIIVSATKIAHSFMIPESIIALTIVAFGTSIPEVATCITAARKKEGAIAVGNIIGADVMNICWVAGASAIANPLVLGRKQIMFMFPAMFVIVGLMLILLRYKYSMTRKKGFVLLGVYLIYLYIVIFIMKFHVY